VTRACIEPNGEDYPPIRFLRVNFLWLFVCSSLIYFKRLCRVMRLDENEGQALLEEYTGPQYEIERQSMVIIRHSVEIDLRIFTCGSNSEWL
jgi:hypothetical protein